jgi:ubiquinone/menaquinone biosynthesis C-methylase UbiE
MTSDPAIAAYYNRGSLLERLNAALVDDGADPANPTLAELSPYDQFHGRGLQATAEMADLMPAQARDHLLDIGSGIGGPARFVAGRFGCRVTGIDLTPEFCSVARHLTGLMHLDDRVAFELGDALNMPFGAAQFDGAYSMNVSMNIADKAGLYREIRRVLKPQGWLVLSEIAQGPGGNVEYPTPWASRAEASFLCTPEETQRGLLDAGFDIVQMRETLAAARAYGAHARALVARGEKPPHRAVMLVHGDDAPRAMANTSRGFAEARLLPIEVLARLRA